VGSCEDGNKYSESIKFDITGWATVRFYHSTDLLI